MSDEPAKGAAVDIGNGNQMLCFEDKAGLYMLYRAARTIGLDAPTIMQLLDAATGYVVQSGTPQIAECKENNVLVNPPAEKAGRKSKPTTTPVSAEPEIVTPVVAPEPVATPEPVVVTAPVTTVAEAKIDIPQTPAEPAPAPTATTLTPEETAAPVVREEVAGPPVTKEDLMKSLKTLIMVDKTAVGDILARHGAKCLSDLKAEQYNSVNTMVTDALAA